MILFSDTFYLFYLITAVILSALFFIMFQLKKRKLNQFFNKNSFFNLIPEFSFSKKLIKFMCAVFAVICMILALARPQLPDETVLEKVEGVELMILADVSKSMLVEDVSPNRLSLMKAQLSRFIQSSQGKHRVGLIAFAGSSFLISPLTSDLSLLVNYLHSLSIDMVSSQGTDFKTALEQAQKSFEGGSTHQGGTRAIIIASDGEDHEVGALELVRSLSEQGIRFFTLGFGTEQGGKIPLEREGGYQKDAQGQEIHSKLKTRTLKEFAKIGKGAFYHISSSSNFSEKLHQDLKTLDQQVFEERNQQTRQELFQYFLVLALIFSFAHLLIDEKKKVS
ncbi:MAG: VWA domain-containing protein [Bdellovibrionales bacterium]|nr:VWA domain-containing protein [Bdellovibrionales bacterium]